MVQEKKQKIDFQDGGNGGHLEYPIGTILAIFHLQVTPMSLPSFKKKGKRTLNTEIHKNSVRIKGPNSVNASKRKHQVNGPFSSGEEVFDLQLPMFPTKFQVNWSFGSGEEEKKIKMAAILDFRSERFWLFFIYVTLMLPTKFQVNMPLGSGEEAKNRFSRWPLATLLPTKFQVNWSFG